MVSINLPPLRERRDDIPLLVNHFLERVSGELERPVRMVEDEAMKALGGYAWPGNVRELENAIRRAAVFARGDVIQADHLPPEIRTPSPTARTITHSPETRLENVLHAMMDEIDSEQVYYDLRNRTDQIIIERALQRVGGNQVQAAQWLGISRTTLRRRIEELGIHA